MTADELEALQPKGIPVENPWIHEQTHKRYLTNITVSELSQSLSRLELTVNGIVTEILPTLPDTNLGTQVYDSFTVAFLPSKLCRVRISVKTLPI